jgi:hypothetical protein
MKTCMTSLALIIGAALLGAVSAAAAEPPSPWHRFDESALPAGGERVIVPLRYRAVRLDRDALRETLAQAPLEFTAEASDSASAVYVHLPMPDGTDQRFRVEESPIMEPGLAAKFPEIKTYRGQGVEDGTASARLGWTAAGFHAIVFSERGTVYVDPYRRGDTEHYVSFFKRDYRAPAGDTFRCLLDEIEQAAFAGPEPPPAFAPSGDTLRTYRLALATTVEYSDFHSTQNPPSKADVMNNGLIPTMNRVNGVYEKDLALRMVMVANNLNVIFVVEPDPYTNNNGVTMLGQNQTTLDSIIGNANYDIGHVFSTGGGGVASLRVPCVAGAKARGVTGRGQPVGDPFDIDYVAHEMGHQWGGNHTFNGNESNCAGNRNGSTAYEVGSGSTIQAYAGICGTQDLQPNSDDYFHNISFVEMQAYSQNGTGDSCAVRTPTGNQAPVIDAGPAFTIPSRTPFALTAAGSDPDGHPLTFCWEEMDLGPAGDGRTDNGSSPILRSFTGTPSPTRTFPKLSDIIGNVTTYGEILPTTTRTMSFRVTARDNRAGGGGVDWDATVVNVVGAAGPFRVTAPNTAVTWPGLTTQAVTWDVAGTAVAPIATANVQILLSTDGGSTFPVVLAASTPNDGTHSVLVPNVGTSTARVKVAAVGNAFFDMSDANFTIQPAAQFAEPASIVVDAGGNGVLEVGETSLVSPAWRNIGSGVLAGATGALSGFGAGTVVDGTAAYGTIPVGATASCTTTGDCYSVLPSAPRPVTHWDSSALETFSPSGNIKSWVLHIGGSFTDVAASSPFFRVVETILHEGVTGGCGTSTYCPLASTTREQMAVFVLVSKEPAGYTPPPCGATPMFADVAASSPFCRWIEELARRGVVGGCAAGAPPAFCPTAPASREQMAVFVLRTLDPALSPPACVAGSEQFADVPASSPFCRWIEELARRGVVTGCGGGRYCPTADVSREQMSVFLSATFGLTLYGL